MSKALAANAGSGLLDRMPAWLPVLGVFLVALLAQQVWTLTTPDVVQWDEDEIHYFQLASGFADLFSAGDLEAASRSWASERPPLYLVWIGLFLSIFGRNPLTAVAAQGLALLFLALFTFDLGRRLHGRLAGLLATALLLCSPLVVVLSRALMMDLALCAAVVATAWVGWVWRALAQPRRSALLGLLCGAGLLVKWTFPVFVGPVLVACLVRELFATDPIAPRKTVLRSTLIAGAVALAAALPWYGFGHGDLFAWLREVSFGGEAGMYGAAQRSALEEALFYPLHIINLFFTLPLFVVALPGLVVFCKRADRGTRWLLLAAMGVPVLAFTLVLNKHLRFVAPALPFFALIAGIGLCSIVQTRLRQVLIGSALVLAGLNLVLFTITRPYYPPEEQVRRHGPLSITWSEGAVPWALATRVALDTPVGELDLFARVDRFYPSRGEIHPGYQTEAIAARLTKLLHGRPGARVVVLPWELEVWVALWHLAQQRDLAFRVEPAVCHPERVAGADVVINRSPRTSVLICDEEEGVAAFEASRGQYSRVAQYRLRDRSLLTIWARRELTPELTAPGPGG